MTVRAPSNVLIGFVVMFFTAVFAATPIGGPLQAVWVVACIGAGGLQVARVARMGVAADATGLVVRNFLRTTRVPWSEVSDIVVGQGDNVSGAVRTVFIKRADGSTIRGRGASTYSLKRAER